LKFRGNLPKKVSAVKMEFLRDEMEIAKENELVTVHGGILIER
jgi:hypothetical protein